MIEVQWSDPASEQLIEIYAYLEQFSPATAEQMRLRLLNLAASLAVFPNRGRPGVEVDTREMATVPPYVLTYEVRDDLVHILDVRHGRRLPYRRRS